MAVELEQLREYMRLQAEEDRKKRSVQVTGQSIEDALNQASIELGIPVKRIEYEVLEKGNKGFAGMARRDYILIAYEAVKEVELPGSGEDLGFDFQSSFSDETIEMDRNGEVFVRLSQDGVYLKVTKPIGRGRKASEKEAVERLNARAVHKYDTLLVNKVVKQADGEYIKVGEFIYNPVNDAVMTVDITDLEMKAFMVIRPPGPGGSDLSADSIIGFLKNNGVVHGIQEEAIIKAEDYPRYGEALLVAEGTKPVNGKNARIIFNFEVDRSNIKLKEKNGRVDFREMNLVQNVVEGQVLAKKVPAEEGQNGRTVTGKLLPSKAGQDIQIGIGKNVTLSEDGLSAVSAINGQVLVSGDKINVEPVYVVAGDVNLKTGGNVVFLGTVVVKGSVDDGFSVKAAGNIEVFGNVGKAVLDAEGDIIVHQGITGKGGGKIQAGKGVWAKFIENADIEAGEVVIATDGIINSNVVADKKIICEGKRATIVGGHLKASEEIHAKTCGSIAGSETILEVGYDPKSKEKLVSLETQNEQIDKELEEVNLNLNTLVNLKKVRKELPEDKQAYFEELTKKKMEFLSAKQELKEEIDTLKNYLASLKIRGKVSASTRVFPGVRIIIKDASLEIKSDYKATTFINEANMIKVTKYEELEEDFSRR